MREPNDLITQRFSDYAEQTADLVGMVDDQSRVVYLNESARKRLGVGAATDLTTADVFPLEAFGHYYEHIRPVLLHTGHWEGEIPVLTAAGDALPMSMSLVAGVGPGGEIEWLVAYGRELDGRRSDLHADDELTGLPRRGALTQQISVALARAAREGQRVGLVFVDLDGMKRINDAFGHQAGDDVLTEVARRMVRTVRVTDTVARVGGDEFVLLLDGVRDLGEANMLAERVRDVLARTTITTRRGDVTATASLGVVLAPSNADPDELLRRADLAMYRAKATGISRVATLDDELFSTVDALANELAVAVSHGRIVPHVQPVVDLTNGTVVGYQGLARWRHPRRGMLTAGAFVDLVADSAAAPVMDLAVIRDAAAAVARRARFGDVLRVYGHLSRRLLADLELERYLSELVDDLGLQPHQLCASIAQPQVSRASSSFRGVLRALRDQGFRLVLTDAGSDWDIGDIVEFGFAEVRLARQFLDGIVEDFDRARVLRGTVGVGTGLGLVVTAVGVENEAQHALVADAGCDLATGYLFGEPIVARAAQ